MKPAICATARQLSVGLFGGTIELSVDAIVIRRQTGKRLFTFLAVDASTYTTEKALRVTGAARSHLTSGGVSDGLLESVRAAASVLAKQPPDAVKVLVIHYPVDYSAVTHGVSSLDNLVLPHDVEGIDRLLDALPNGTIDFAVHGHLHTPRIYNHRGVAVISVGTVFQRHAPVNDLFFVKVSESGQIRAEHHIWAGTGFKQDENPEYNRALN